MPTEFRPPMRLPSGRPSDDVPYAMARIFTGYLLDYIGSAESRPAAKKAICPFVSPALSNGAMYYSEISLGDDCSYGAAVTCMHGYIDWFAAHGADFAGGQPAALLVSFPDWPSLLISELAKAHVTARPAAFERDLTTSLFNRDPGCDEANANAWPEYFFTPTPYYVVRNIVQADLELSICVPEMFPAYYRLFAEYARIRRLRSTEVRRRWLEACVSYGLPP